MMKRMQLPEVDTVLGAVISGEIGSWALWPRSGFFGGTKGMGAALCWRPCGAFDGNYLRRRANRQVERITPPNRAMLPGSGTATCASICISLTV